MYTQKKFAQEDTMDKYIIKYYWLLQYNINTKYERQVAY